MVLGLGVEPSCRSFVRTRPFSSVHLPFQLQPSPAGRRPRPDGAHFPCKVLAVVAGVKALPRV